MIPVKDLKSKIDYSGRVKPRKPLNIIGRKVYVYYEGERYKSPAWVLGSFRKFWLVYFVYDDKSIMAVTKQEIAEVTQDRLSEKTRLRYRKETMHKAQEVIRMIKAEDGPKK